MKSPDIITALKPVVEIFDELSIPYYIGGSIASSIYGIARATMDIDMIADIKINHIPYIKKNLETQYYIDEDMIIEAIDKKSSFNLIHLETAIKVDVFILENDPYQKKAIQRKTKDTLNIDDIKTEFYFSSPEDIIINKLLWYELGEQVSEHHWLDILGVIKVQGKSLDKKYLKYWTEKLNLLELIKKAFQEADFIF